MCFDDDSAPPIPVISGAAVSHDDLTLIAADGNEFAAFRAIPDGAPGSGVGEAAAARAGGRRPSAGGATTGVIILPDVRGLYHFYEELALRFAERGYVALAMDYFGRTLGVGKRENDWDFRPHVDATTQEGIQADVRACAEDLRARGCTSIFTIGFCFGGSNSWNAAASGHGLKGAIGYYGRPARFLDNAARVDAPLLILQGGADQAISHEDNLELEQALQEHGKQYELIEYDGAPHSFFDRKQEEFKEASDDSWRRVLEFISRYE